jgi:poly-gamma-glutamate synthesis protein (capsule biosynthesis protein)
MGQALLRDPTLTPLAPLAPWLDPASVRFVNLEGPLSEQGGQTMSPRNSLIFTGPPIGAEALARSRIDVVSTANNHAWDYGKAALLETLTHLDRVGIRHVGTGVDLAAAQAPVVLERGGMKIGFLAATGIWNQGALAGHPGRDHVAAADASWLVPAVRSLKQQGVDVVAVSYHGGEQYQEAPISIARNLHRALIDAGADVILGHHPHVLQGVGWHRGRPIFYSLGNLLMRMHSEYPWTGLSMVARLTFRKGEAPRAEVCPLRILGMTLKPLHEGADAKAQWSMFAARMRQLSSHTGGAVLGEPGPDGCAEVRAKE